MGFFDGKIKKSETTPNDSNSGGFFSSGVMPITPKKTLPKSTVKDKAIKVANVVGDFLGGKQIGEAVGTEIARSKTRKGEDIITADYEKLTPTMKAKLKKQGVPTSRQAQLDETAKSIKGPTALQIAADIGQVGLTFFGGSLFGKLGAKVGGATLGNATKLTPGALKTAQNIGRAAEGAAGFGTFGATNALARGESVPEALKTGLVDAALGTIAGPVLGTLGDRLKKKAPTTLSAGYITKSEQAIKQATEEATSRTTRDVGKDIRTIVEELGDDAGFNKNQINKIMENLRKSKPNAKRFTDEEIAREAIKVQPDYYKPYTPPDQLPTIGFDAKTKSNGVIPKSVPVVEAPVTPGVPKTPTATPVRQESIERIAKIRDAETPDLNDFERQVNRQQEAEVMQMDMKHVEDVAMGRARPKGDLPADAYLAVMKNLAEDMRARGDVTLADKLSQSNIGRKTGQALQSNQIARKGNFTDILRDIRISMEDNLPPLIKNNKDKEVKKIADTITTALNSAKGIPTKGEILSIIDGMKC